MASKLKENKKNKDTTPFLPMRNNFNKQEVTRTSRNLLAAGKKSNILSDNCDRNLSEIGSGKQLFIQMIVNRETLNVYANVL